MDPEIPPGTSVPIPIVGSPRSADSPRSAVGSPRSIVGSPSVSSQKANVGSPMSGVGSQKSAVGAQKSAVGSPMSAVGSPVSGVGSQMSAVGSQMSAVGSPVSGVGSPPQGNMMETSMDIGGCVLLEGEMSPASPRPVTDLTSPAPGTNPKDSPVLPRRFFSEHAPQYPGSLRSVCTEGDDHPANYGSYGASVPIRILQHLNDDIRSSSQSIHGDPRASSDSYSHSPAHFGSYKATPPLSIPQKGAPVPLRRSRFDSLRSIFSTQHSVTSVGSHTRVNLVTEAAALLPSLCSSAFSVDRIEEASMLNIPETNGTGAVLDRMAPPSTKTASLRENLDILDDPAYTDTVKSTDSNNSLRRSMSVPSKYHYKASTHRPHAREVFEDFIHQEELDAITELPTSKPVFSKNKHKPTMDDLYENPEYLDSVQSTSSGAALLARTAITLSRGKDLITSLVEPPRESPQKYVKNLVMLSLSFMLVFTAYLSLRNLQSSINPEGGLALFALSSVYAFLFLGAIFATTIVQRLRPKVTMMVCMVALLLYVLANFYPHYYTLVPASMLAGFCLSNLWTAHATYLTNIAASYAELTNKSIFLVIGKFNGIFFMFFGISQVLGGVISSTVLMSEMTSDRDKHKLDMMSNFSYETSTWSYEGSTHTWASVSDAVTVPDNQTTVQCGAQFSHAVFDNNHSVQISKSQLYLLLGIFGGCTIVGMAMMWLFMDRLEGIMKKSHATLWDQLTAVFRWFVDWRVMCLVCMMFYTLIEMSFMFGEFTTAFVTCPVGVHMVGYAMLCMSAASSLSSYINGKVLKYVGRPPIFIAAGLLHMSLMVVMLTWQPSPDTLYVTFIITGLWGIADGVWFTQIISLLGVLFSHNKEPAFAGLKMCQSLGACITFITAKYIPTYMKIYLMLMLLVLALAGYIFLEVRLKCVEKKLAVNGDAKQNSPV